MQIEKKDIIKTAKSEIGNGEIFGYREDFFIVNSGLHFYLVNPETEEKFGPYLHTTGFYNGYAAVKRDSIQGKNYWSIIDKKGSEVAEFINGNYSSIYFSDGYAKIDNKKFIALNGKVIEYKPNDFTVISVSDFKNGRAIVTCKILGKQKYYYIDRDFKKINNKMYDIAEDFNSDRAVAGKNNKRYIIDLEGNTVFKYNLNDYNMKTVSSYSEGMLSYAENGIWGHLDIYGRKAIEPRFRRSKRFSDGVITYSENGAIYMMDKEGNKKLLLTREESFNYAHITEFKNGYALLYYERLNPLCDIVDKEGNIIEISDNISLYDNYVVLSDNKSFIKLEDLNKVEKEYQIIITKDNKKTIKSFDTEEKRNEYYFMLQQEINHAVNLSRKVYNEYLDKLIEGSVEKNSETHKVKVKKGIK